MAKFKTFDKLEKGDYVFSAQIKDSHLYQNCVGKIFDRYLIKDKMVNESNDVVFTVIYDKSTLLKNDWKPSESEPTIVFSAECGENVVTLNTLSKDKNSDTINKFIFATNVQSLREQLEEYIEMEELKIKQLEKLLTEKKDVCHNIKINYNLRKGYSQEYEAINVIPDYQETVVTEEVYV